MNAEKVFARMVKAHSKNKDVTFVSNYDGVKAVAKYIAAMPDSFYEDFSLTRPDWDGYDKEWLLTYDDIGGMWCQKARFEDGRIAQGAGLYLIDEFAIGNTAPEEFCFENDSTIKLVGDE